VPIASRLTSCFVVCDDKPIYTDVRLVRAKYMFMYLLLKFSILSDDSAQAVDNISKMFLGCATLICLSLHI
jgi:hypothetical protein